MVEYPNYDGAVIVSGDGDFYCLVKYLQKMGKLTKLIVPDENRYSSLYRKLTGYIMSVGKLRGKLEIKKREA
jgi:uncharacterized LabA/DUF88 family protein